MFFYGISVLFSIVPIATSSIHKMYILQLIHPSLLFTSSSKSFHSNSPNSGNTFGPDDGSLFQTPRAVSNISPHGGETRHCALALPFVTGDSCDPYSSGATLIAMHAYPFVVSLSSIPVFSLLFIYAHTTRYASISFIALPPDASLWFLSCL